jgi:hypothetical protein
MDQKAKGKRQISKGKNKEERSDDSGRRKFLLAGAGALAATGVGLAGAYNAGWFDSEPATSTLPARPQQAGGNLTPVSSPVNSENALRAVNEMLEHYARDLNNAAVLIHAVRGCGKHFKLTDGANAVDLLCSRYAIEKEINGKRYVHFKRDAEVHENSFLKTFLEAGVSLDQPIIAGGRKYTLRDLAENGQALFRCDPDDLYKYDDTQFRYDTSYFPPRQAAPGRPAGDLRGELIHEHLPWGLIAFSTLSPPEKGTWKNVYGETINLATIIDRSLNEYESSCALGRQELARGEAAPKNFRDEIKKYSCFGLHTAYSYLVCLKNGYRGGNLEERMKQVMDFVTYRLKGDAEAIDREYAQEGKGNPPHLVEAFRRRALIKFYGHAFEAINYAKLHHLMTFTPAQDRRIETGRQDFDESIVKMRAMDWGMLRKSLGEKFISDVVIALGHAARAMKLLTPQNPDTMA